MLLLYLFIRLLPKGTAEQKCQAEEWKLREDEGLNEDSFLKELEVESYNFRTILYWNVNSGKSVNTSSVPYYTVEIRKYKTDTCVLVQNCTWISYQYCDITKVLQDVDDLYLAIVKAYVGSKEFEITTEFSHKDPGVIIGPPKINITFDGKGIAVLLQHPLTPFEDRWTVRKIYTDFNYLLFLPKERTDIVNNCTFQYCTTYLLAPEPPFNYCVSAQGISDHWGVKGKISNETCMSIKQEANPGSQDINIITITVVLIPFVCVVVLVALKLICLLKKKKEHLPKSLGNIVRSFQPHPSNEECPENQLLVVVPPEKIVKVSEDHHFICGEDEQHSHKEMTSSSENSFLLNGNVKKEEPVEVTSLVEKNGILERAYGIESLSELTDACNMNTCSNNSQLPVTGTVRSMAHAASSGYDRPHVLNILIEDSNEDYITGYKTVGQDKDQEV